MARQTYAYLGAGEISMREVGAAAPFIKVGNCSALTFGAELDTKELKNFRQPGGGTYAKVDRVSRVSINLTAHDIDAANLARASNGQASDLAAGSVSAEPVVAYPGGITPLTRPPATITTVVEPGTGGDTYAEGTDYRMTPGGIEVLEGGNIPAPVDGEPNIVVTYTNTAGQVIEAMVNSGKTYELLFEGLNEAESDKPVIVQAYRVKFAPSNAINFIGDDFAALELVGTALSDSTKVGAGISKYWKATIIE